MACAAELRSPEPGDGSGDLRRDDRLPILRTVGDLRPAEQADRRASAPALRLVEDEEVLWMAAQPGRGQMIRARHSDHHTSSLVFTRDDSEGHSAGVSEDDDRTWWSHDMKVWMSWRAIGQYLSSRPETFIVEILVRPGRGITHRTCAPDGPCYIAQQGGLFGGH